jgi:hypothetical protein
MRIWRYIYLAWAALWVLGSYRMLSPDRTAPLVFGWSYIVLALLLFCIAPPAIVILKQRFGFEMTFRRPSMDRSPFGWGRDPLQVFRLYLVTAVSMSAGAGLALAHANHRGVMMFWGCAAVSVGLFLGERLIYLVYAKRIA